MPLFFFLSGYLEKDKTLKENIKQGIRGLIVPYIILYILSFFLWVPSILLWHRDVFENSTHVKELLVKPILGMILGGAFNTDYSTMINGPLWFIVGLFSAKIIHSLLIKIAGKNIRRYIFLNIPVLALVYVLNLFSIDLLFSINSALLAFPFFSLGYFLHTVKPDLFLNMKNNFKNVLSRLFIIVISFLLVMILCKYNGMVNVAGFDFGKNLFLFYAAAFLGIVMIVSIASYYQRNLNFIRIISSGTIFILASHVYFDAPLIRIMGMYLKPLSLFTAIPISIVTTLIMILPIVILQKYFPVVLGNRK